jgi:hypothetical protein
MKNIDFLPARYHERYAARAAIVKRWTIVLGISIVITPLAVYQLLAHHRVCNRFVLVEPEYKKAQDKSKRLDDLRKKLELVKGEAALLAWLRHPWPRSQVLAHVHGPLPQSMRLTSIKLNSEPKFAGANAPGRPRARRPGEGQQPGAEDTRPSAEKDLQYLLELVGQNERVVTLNGVTLNSTELHAYVAQLNASRLFGKSELRSLETAPGQETATQNFEIRLVLDAGHSLPPKLKEAATQTNSATAQQSAPPASEIARLP